MKFTWCNLQCIAGNQAEIIDDIELYMLPVYSSLSDKGIDQEKSVASNPLSVKSLMVISPRHSLM